MGGRDHKAPCAVCGESSGELGWMRDKATELAARLAEVTRERDEAVTRLGYERDHSKTLSEANSALHSGNAKVEAYLAKVRGEYTKAKDERDSARAEAERMRSALSKLARVLRNRGGLWAMRAARACDDVIANNSATTGAKPLAEAVEGAGK
jgi:chromosome segregation ATPase